MPKQVELCGVIGSRQAEAVKKMSLENVRRLGLGLGLGLGSG